MITLHHKNTKRISDLIPYVNNTRTHSDDQISQIASSIMEFGFTNPVLIDENDSVIAGHGRIKAAQKLGMDDVPCIVLEGLSEPQRKAYIIADNKLALNAGWDDELLKLELKSLDDVGFDISLTGFDIDFIENENSPAEDGDVDCSKTTQVVSAGDKWIMGHHALKCGDSTNADDIDDLFSGAEWDVCVFDPPYEIESLYTDAMPSFAPGKKIAVMWDFKRFATAPSAALSKGWTPQYEFIWDCVQSWYTPNRPLARHKAVGIFADDPKFNTDKSIIFDGKKRESKKVKNTRGVCDYKPLDGAKHIATVEQFPNTAQTDDHGHGKPIEWITAIFRGIGGSVYYDPFGGSGATLISCENMGIPCYTMELSPEYCDQIITRWQSMTGMDAIHDSSGIKYNDMVTDSA